MTRGRHVPGAPFLSNHMILPDYSGASLVNLMRSLADACGGEHLPYSPLQGFDLSPAHHARNLVLLVIDGMGDDWLDGAKNSALRPHRVGRLTSVFPSTTATAITTFMTGLAPRQHGLTGWSMYLEEVEREVSILPLTPRSGPGFEDQWSLPPRLFSGKSFFDRIHRHSTVVSPEAIVHSPFNAYHSGRSSRLAYKTPGEMFAAIEARIRADADPHYIYAYYPDFDSAAHRHGTSSEHAKAVFQAVDAAFAEFIERIRGTDTFVIVTADHGFIDSPAEHLVELESHPELASLLARPLCGERRVAYCYVEPDKRAAFEDYVRTRLGHCAGLFESASLIDAGWFGPGPADPRLAKRIGDYTLVMLGDWTIKDWVPGEKRYRMIGVHGGLTEAEMYVPLVVVQP